jgi:hypothetical protein
VKNDSSDHITRSFAVVLCPGSVVVTLSITFSYQRFSICSHAVVLCWICEIHVGQVLFSNRVFKVNIQFWCPVTCAAVVL